MSSVRLSRAGRVIAAALLFSGGIWLSSGDAVTAQRAGEAITPYKIAVPEPVLTDLKDRLARTRFPDEIENS